MREMGDPRKLRKHYTTPHMKWNRALIEEERGYIQTYALKNKREVWKTRTLLAKKRKSARSLLALAPEERARREKALLESLYRVGVVARDARLQDVLALTPEAFFERRLASRVWRRGLADTAKQARQLVVHGHIAVKGARVTAPGYLVPREEEATIAFYNKAVENKLKKLRRERAGKGRKPAAGAAPGPASEKPALQKREAQAAQEVAR